MNDTVTENIRPDYDQVIQGVLALENSFNRVGLDHVLLVRVASTAVATKLKGGNREQVMAALSQAWVDGSALRTYRHAPNAGPLANPADRDHCLQYMAAVPLIFGDLQAEHYEDGFHRAHPEIDRLRDQMEVVEEPRYSADYLDPAKRSIANALQVFFTDGNATEKVEVEYPVGHRRRREEGIPLLEEKFRNNLATCFPPERCAKIFALCKDQKALEAMPVNQFMDQLVI